MTREPKLTRRLLIAPVLFLCAAAAGCGVGPGNANADQPVDSEPTLGELVFEEDENLQKRLAGIAGAVQGKVGIYALLIEENRSVSVNGGERFAMQSVVKLPVAMAVLEMVSAGELKLEDKIEFSKNELVNPNQRSPLRDKNPNGGSASIGELIRLAVSESDGTACDVLTRIVGGPVGLQNYIDALGITAMKAPRTHKEFGHDWAMQYENWATPEAAVDLLEIVNRGEGGLGTHKDLLIKHMTEGPTGANRIKGLLPAGTQVAHKTGTGGSRDGVTSATNDVGIITLPSGKHVAIAVLVGDARADEKTREAVIAQAAKAAWDTWTRKSDREH
jgi:beta-lactamase class A